MSLLVLRENDVLNVSLPLGAIDTLSGAGSDFAWAVTAVLIVSFLALLTICFSAPEGNRIFHYLFTCSLLVGAVTYFAQASDFGWAAVAQSDGHIHIVPFARYIYWAMSFPSVTLALGLLCNGSWVTTFTNLFIACFWVLAYLAGSYITTAYKWGFFAFGTFAWVILVMGTLKEGREYATRLGIASHYMALASWANVLWLLYPVGWILSDGTGVIDRTSSLIFFGVLDMLMVPTLAFGFWFFGRQWDFHRLHLDLSEYRYGLKGDLALGLVDRTHTSDGN